LQRHIKYILTLLQRPTCSNCSSCSSCSEE